jgi:hypothetical protein
MGWRIRALRPDECPRLVAAERNLPLIDYIAVLNRHPEFFASYVHNGELPSDRAEGAEALPSLATDLAHWGEAP